MLVTDGSSGNRSRSLFSRGSMASPRQAKTSAGGMEASFWSSLRSCESEKWACLLLSHVQLFTVMDWSLLGTTVHGILQARILEWAAIPLPGDLPNPGIESRSLAFQAASLPSDSPLKIYFLSTQSPCSRIYIFANGIVIKTIDDRLPSVNLSN